MKTAIRKLGNDRAVVIPDAILAHLALASDEVEIVLDKDAVVIRAPTISVPAPLEPDTPVWDDFNSVDDDDVGQWKSLTGED